MICDVGAVRVKERNAIGWPKVIDRHALTCLFGCSQPTKVVMGLIPSITVNLRGLTVINLIVHSSCDDDDDTQRRNSRYFYNLLSTQRTVSSMHAQVARTRLSANHMKRIRRLSHTTCGTNTHVSY